MINNTLQIKDETLKALISLAKSERMFLPCGSRYFGYFTPESDYDFFFQDYSGAYTPEWLMENGFNLSGTTENYMDVNTIATWYKGKVQVMEVRSESDRLRIQDFIVECRKTDSAFRPPKGDRHWWNEQYCRMFPDRYTMPEEITNEDKRAFREEARYR